MSQKTRSIKTKDVTSEETEEYLMQVTAHLNEIARLEDEKSDYTKSLNAQIKAEQDKLEKIRLVLNEGVIITLHNYMDKNTHKIIWKDDNGNEVERTPFDEEDWGIWEKQYGPKQKPLFDEADPPPKKDQKHPALNQGEIIDGKCEDIEDDRSPFDEHGEEEVEAERDAL